MGNRSHFIALASLLFLGTACTDEPTRSGSADTGARQGVAPAPASISYQAHVQDYGWVAWVSNGQVAGTTGQARRLEALRIDLSGSSSPAAQICYEAYVQGVGWQGAVCGNGQMVGTVGQALRMEGIKIWVKNAPDLAVCYSAHVENIGWQNEVCNGEAAGAPGHALRVEAITIQLRKPFYAWTESQTGMPNWIRLQGVAAWMGQHESYDRQMVHMGNCEKQWSVSAAFVDAHKNKGMIYFIGDEPDHNQVAFGACGSSTQTPLFTPEEYAQKFHEAVTYIRGIDPSARFSNGGFTPRGATPTDPQYLHFIEYADAFIEAYKKLPGTGGQAPPIEEWRFHSNNSTAAELRDRMNEAAAWAATRGGGKRVFVGSFNGPEMQAMIEHIESDSRLVGGSWWNYDYRGRGNGSFDGEIWPDRLTNENGTLNTRGEQFRDLIK